MVVVETNQEAKDEGDGGLKWTVVGKSSGGDYEEVKEETEYSEADEDAGDGLVDEEEVVGKSVTEEEESDLKHEG